MHCRTQKSNASADPSRRKKNAEEVLCRDQHGSCRGADGSKMTVQQMRQPIPLSLNKVSKVLGQPDVYVYDCNPEDIYEKSHLKGSIHANKADWMNLLPKDKKNSFEILYCINRMCTVSFEAALEAIKAGYENVYVMPDGIQGCSPIAAKSRMLAV